jgi:hypothetical protein
MFKLCWHKKIDVSRVKSKTNFMYGNGKPENDPRFTISIVVKKNDTGTIIDWDTYKGYDRIWIKWDKFNYENCDKIWKRGHPMLSNVHHFKELEVIIDKPLLPDELFEI